MSGDIRRRAIEDAVQRVRCHCVRAEPCRSGGHKAEAGEGETEHHCIEFLPARNRAKMPEGFSCLPRRDKSQRKKAEEIDKIMR